MRPPSGNATTGVCAAPSDWQAFDRRRRRSRRRGGRDRHVDGYTIAEVRADEVRDIFLATAERVQEKLRGGELIFVGRILQQFVGLDVGRVFFRFGARKAEVAEGVFSVKQQAIEEGVLAVDAVAEHDVRHFVRDHGCQLASSGRDVDQAAAEHDGMADGDDSRSKTQHAQRISGWMSRLLVLPGYLRQCQELCPLPGGGQQAEPLQPSMTLSSAAVPIALCQQRADIVGRRGLIPYGVCDSIRILLSSCSWAEWPRLYPKPRLRLKESRWPARSSNPTLRCR